MTELEKAINEARNASLFDHKEMYENALSLAMKEVENKSLMIGQMKIALNNMAETMTIRDNRISILETAMRNAFNETQGMRTSDEWLNAIGKIENILKQVIDGGNQ